MGMRLQVLASGSSGNCALLETAQTRILIDAGLSGRQTVRLLEAIGKPIETVDAVFITHEHGDHCTGLRGLARFPHLKFFANYPTAQILQQKYHVAIQWKLFETGSAFRFADLVVESALLPHDAMEPVGLVFRSGGADLFDPPQSFAYLTDLGYLPPAIGNWIRDVQVLMMEANHCPDLLEADAKRPLSVKQRIRGRHGHLSNDSVAEFLQSVDRPRWQRVLLGHLSRDCNSPERVMKRLLPLALPFAIDCLAPDRQPFAAFEIGEC